MQSKVKLRLWEQHIFLSKPIFFQLHLLIRPFVHLLSTDVDSDEELNDNIDIDNMDVKELGDDDTDLECTESMQAEWPLDNLKLEGKLEDERPKPDTEANNSEPDPALHGAQSECIKEDYRFNTSFKEAKEVYQYFWQPTDVFSQSFPSGFSTDGKTFCCTEQYVMYTKACRLTKNINN